MLLTIAVTPYCECEARDESKLWWGQDFLYAVEEDNTVLAANSLMPSHEGKKHPLFVNY